MPANELIYVLKNVKKIAQSPDGSKFAYLTENEKKQYEVWVGSYDYFKKQLIPSRIKRMPSEFNLSMVQMLWCSDDCVCLIFQSEIMLIGPNHVQKT